MAHDPYREILAALTEARVAFIVGGGVACVLQGVERVTMGVDLAVAMTSNNLPGFIRVMRELRLKPRVPIAPESLLDPVVVEAMVREKHALVFTFVDPEFPLRQVDIFLRNDLSYENLLPDSEWVELGSISVRILTKQKLLALKRGIRPLRAKDALDIEYLSRHAD